MNHQNCSGLVFILLLSHKGEVIIGIERYRIDSDSSFWATHESITVRNETVWLCLTFKRELPFI